MSQNSLHTIFIVLNEFLLMRHLCLRNWPYPWRRPTSFSLFHNFKCSNIFRITAYSFMELMLFISPPPAELSDIDHYHWGLFQNDAQGIPGSSLLLVLQTLHKNSVMPTNDSPVSFLFMWKLFRDLTRRPSFNSSHDV